MQYLALLKEGLTAAAVVATSFALPATYSLPPHPSEPPYLVPARQGAGARLSCVSAALTSLQRTGLENHMLVSVVNGEGVQGVMVLLPGSEIPDPGTVPTGGNVKLERILNLCKPDTA